MCQRPWNICYEMLFQVKEKKGSVLLQERESQASVLGQHIRMVHWEG